MMQEAGAVASGSDTITAVLAVWGAVLSTIAVGWNVYAMLRDRVRIKVTATVGHVYPDHVDKNYLFWTITNVGRRPVMITNVGGHLKKHKLGPHEQPVFFVDSQALPTWLNEGEYHHERTDKIHELLTPKLKRLVAHDSAGREYRVTRRNLQQVFKDAEGLKEDDTEESTDDNQD